VRSRRLVPLLALTSLWTACTSDRVVEPEGPRTPHRLGASFARPGATNPALQYEITTPDGGQGIFSDQASPYVNGVCGTYGIINLATNNAILDPDRDYKSSMGACGPRRFVFKLPVGGTVSDGSYVTIGGATIDAVDFYVIPLGQTVDQRIGFTTTRATTGCDRISYGYAPGDGSSPVQVTRMNDTTWTLASIPNTAATCSVSAKGGTETAVWSGPLPINMTITQVP